MKLSFIGTGDAFTKYGHNSAILSFGNTNLMIDCPDSNYSRIDYAGVENIFITHLHADHINGLEKFAYYKKYGTPGAKKTRLYIPSEIKNDLWNSLKQGLGTTTEGKKNLDDYFQVFEVDKTFEISGQEFGIIQTKHVPNMKSYGLWAKEHFYYSGDSLVDEKLLKNLKENVKHIFHDCHLWNLKIASHASFSDLENLPDEIKEKTILMHYRDGFENEEKVGNFNLAKTRKIYEV